MTMRIGVIGVGTIGGPLAANIVRGGHPVMVHDLRPEAVAAMTALGATAPGGIAALARASDVVITILPDAPDVEAAALGPDGIAEHIRQGAVYLDMSTIDPGTSRRIGAVLAAKGVGMLDAPITRSVDHARAGRSALLVGGEPALLARVRPILACMADTITHCGPLGSGHAMKLVNNFMGAGLVALVSEAMAMGMKAGLGLEAMMDATGRTGTRNAMLQEVLPARAFKGDFGAGFMCRLALKDQRLALAMAAAGGVPTPLGRTVYGLLEEATRRWPTDDFTSLLRLVEEAAGVQVRLAGHDGAAQAM